MKSTILNHWKSLSFILFVSLLGMACKDESKFEISGKFTNAQPKTKVYLFGVDKNSETPVDSTVLSDKGEFRFTRSTPDVDFFRVKIDNSEYMLIAKNGDKIQLSADLADPTLVYQISGAEEADKLEELNKNKNRYTAKIAAIQAQFEQTVASQPHNREAIANQMRPALIKENEGLVDYILKFAMDNTSSLAGFYAINSLNPGDYEEELIAYSDKIKSKFNNNAAVTEFLVRMTKLKAVQVGQVAPDFTMNTMDGKSAKLSDFRGKYVLLDFWASWCQPCRIENPNLVKAYQQFKDKNFTIVGVSLDKDPAAWKQAVIADGLNWTQLSELKDFDSPTVRLYQIDAIPSSFLLDPSGKIVAKKLTGGQLVEFLSKTLR